jgi:hypothetical protein
VASLQGADRLGGETGSLGELVLGQTSRLPESAKEEAELGLITAHEVTLLRP